MTSPEQHWWSTRAGEYVLGTLRGEDLELFERILRHDTEMRTEVARWERRLAPLHENTRAEAPAGHVWPRIVERIRDLEANPPGTDSAHGGEPANDARPSALNGSAIRGVPTGIAAAPRRDDRRTVPDGPPKLWQTLAGLATAACVALSVLVGVLMDERVRTQDTMPFDVDGLAVVLSDEDGKPYFLVETDYGNLRVRVTALTPPPLEEERNFQLWQALPDRSAVRPVALLPGESGRARVFDVGSLIDGSDLFGVSLEPVGAPTDGGPTGPVVAHGDFLKTSAESRP